MARDAGLADLAPDGLVGGADRLRHGAARVEAAARRWMGRARDLADQRHRGLARWRTGSGSGTASNSARV